MDVLRRPTNSLLGPCLLVATACFLPAMASAGELLQLPDAFFGAPSVALAPVPGIQESQATTGEDAPNLPLRNALIIGAGAAGFAAYGLNKWWDTGFGGGFKTTDEGWFGANTPYGGADKLGHMYSSYATTRLLAPLFEYAGNSREAAVSLAMWSSLGVHIGVEVLDGYSRQWKFSAQDAIADAAGVALGVMLETSPELDEKLDFRLHYRASRQSDFDPFGDYSGQRYLLVLKADGFESLRSNRFLRYFELAVGYGTRGYDNGGERRRDVYVGLSLNLSRLLADGAYGGRMHSTPVQRATERVFELVQLPTIGYVRSKLD